MRLINRVISVYFVWQIICSAQIHGRPGPVRNSDEKVRPLGRRDELIVEDLDGETVVYDLRTHRASCLNAVAALVWKRCDGTRTVAELANELAVNTGLPADSELVLLCLTRLRAAGLLERTIDFVPVTRRQIIQRLSLRATLITLLPVITTVQAQAQVNLSSCVPRQQCALPMNQCNPCYQGAQLNANQCNNRRCHNGDCRPDQQTPCP